MLTLYTINLGSREWQTTNKDEAFAFMRYFGIEHFELLIEPKIVIKDSIAFVAWANSVDKIIHTFPGA